MLNLKGNDLLNINVKGDKIGKCLNFALAAVIEEKCINEKESLLKYLNNINLI
jgi:hypothetical protein